MLPPSAPKRRLSTLASWSALAVLCAASGCGPGLWVPGTIESVTYLYVSHTTTDEIGIYRVERESGSLTPIGSRTTSSDPVELTVHGGFLVAAVSVPGVESHRIDPETGELHAADLLGFGTNPAAVAFASGNLYVSDLTDSSIRALRMNSRGEFQSLPFSPVAAFSTGALIASPGGAHLYGLDTLGNQLEGFDLLSDGDLTPTPSLPLATPTNPADVAVTPSGDFLYVCAQGASQVARFQVTTGGTVSSLGNTSGTNPCTQLLVHPSGRFLYVLEPTAIAAYTINASTGNLTAIATFGSFTNPFAFTVEPSGEFLYVSDSAADVLVGFHVNRTTGGLTEVDASPFPTLVGTPEGLVTATLEL
ncbi:MAG: beta-propeller fold lactonase family protein [Bdellovibrionales bacterium]|nr:beta-propeller fold lactonase family protein [Bdellovibrionales bacterium]